MKPAAITATCVLCAGGRGTEQVWATTRSGVSRIGSSNVKDKNSDTIQMGLVPEGALPPLPEDIDALGLHSRARRMLRLAVPVIRAIAAEAGDGPHTVFTGLPQLDPAESPWVTNFHQLLGQFAGVRINLEASRVVPMGRASALMAIEAGIKAIEQGLASTAIVGGVDTFLDLKLLAELDAEGRILGPQVPDGFIPGEGAGYLVLKSPESATGPGPSVLALAATSMPDPGHRYGKEPAKGEGLSKTIELLRACLASPPPPVNTTFAGFNGENFDAKMWGVARLRHNDFFTPTMSMQHPASSIGDTGAACGAIMSSLAAIALARGDRTGPTLVWAASDRESRACALISTGH